jgi:putative FmdB family regulatory protein
MPIYEYRCNACGHEFEEWQKMSDEPVKTCPKCRARKVERLISQCSFQLKGTGWYQTDYGKRSSGEGAHKKAPKHGSGESSGESGGGNEGGGNDGGSTPPTTEGTPEPAKSSGETRSEPKSETKTETKTETKGKSKSARAA